MIKKIFIALIIVLILAGGIAAYFFFFAKKSTTTNQPGFQLSDIFPFSDDGKAPPTTGNNDNTSGDTTTPQEPTEPTKAPKLRMITRGPVAGAAVFDVLRELPRDPNVVDKNGKPLPVQTEPATKVRYTEVATGHVNETYLDKPNITKLTTTSIPKIVESYFAGKGATQAILRYAGDNNSIQSFSGSIPLIPYKDGTPDTTLRGSYLAENIVSMAVSPDQEKIVTVAKDTNGSIGTISLPDGTKKTQIFSFALSELIAQWPSTKVVTITTKPAAKFPGYMYSIDVTSKVMKKVIGGINGLTTLSSPDMKMVLFSKSVNNSVTTSIYNIAAKSVVPLPGATTLPEKCVWQSSSILYCAVPSYFANADYPDAWYQGSVSFVDQIYKIDVNNLTTTSIGTPSSVGASIDAINLVVDPSNTFLVFTNKKDGSLWSLDLRPETN